MPRLPRDLSAADLIVMLRRLGYAPVRQTGSHVRLRTLRGGEHNLTIPSHDPLRVGALNAVLAEIASHHGLSRASLLDLLTR